MTRQEANILIETIIDALQPIINKMSYSQGAEVREKREIIIQKIGELVKEES